MTHLKSLTGFGFAVASMAAFLTAACAPKSHDVTTLDKTALSEVSRCGANIQSTDLGQFECGYFKVKLFTCASAPTTKALGGARSTASTQAPSTPSAEAPAPAPGLSSLTADQAVAAEFTHFVKNSPAGMNPIRYHGYALLKKADAATYSGKLSLNAYDRDDKFARNLKGGAFTMASSDFNAGFHLTATEPHLVFGKGGVPVWKTLVWKTSPPTYETNCVKSATNAD